MEKVTKTFRFDKRAIAHSKTNPNITSFAEWCSEQYLKEFMSEEYFKQQIEEHKHQIDLLKKQIDFKEDENTYILNQYETAWIKHEAPKRIAKATEEGVYKYFVNKYNRKDITRRQFRLLVEKLTKND